MVVKAGKRFKVNKKHMNRHAGTSGLHRSMTEILASGIRFHQAGDFAKAESMYRQILHAEPGHADALHLIGVIAHQTGKNWTAVEYIEKAIAINPSTPYYHNNLGNALLNLRKTDEAVESFNEAIRLKPDYFEAYNNLGNAFKEQGRENEAVEQFQISIRLNPEYEVAHNNLANLLKDIGRPDEAVGYYQSAVKLKPDFAEAYFNLGAAFIALDNYNKAVEQYRRAIKLKPDYADAYNNLGNILKKQKKYNDAVLHYKKAIAVKSDFAEAYNNLGDAYRLQGRLDEALELCRKATRLQPYNEKFYVNFGNTLYDRGDFQEAERQFQKAINLKPDFADAHFNKGIALLLRSEFEKGWREYEWRFQSREISQNIGYRNTDIPVWDGSMLNGKTILVRSEQGLGDHIQFVRYMPVLKERGGRVVFECRKELMRLFEDYTGIDILIEESRSNESVPAPDVCVQLLNLPSILNTTLDTIFADVPYLRVATEAVSKWRSKIDGKAFKVGLAWSGNPAHKNDHNRSCRFSDFTPMGNVPGVAFYSLQKEGIDENDELCSAMHVKDIGRYLDDFHDTAAVIENLDLVISVDTSVVHVAGALGKPVWTLLPFVPDWRWMLEREDTPWYPTMRLFRQPAYGDWKSVINKVADELRKQVQLKGATNE